jgi:hypothetical protein
MLARGPGGFSKIDRGRYVLIHRVGNGDGFSASWGYTIWHDGRCVAGQCNGRWTAYEAQKEADRAMAAQVTMDGESADKEHRQAIEDSTI